MQSSDIGAACMQVAMQAVAVADPSRLTSGLPDQLSLVGQLSNAQQRMAANAEQLRSLHWHYVLECCMQVKCLLTSSPLGMVGLSWLYADAILSCMADSPPAVPCLDAARTGALFAVGPVRGPGSDLRCLGALQGCLLHAA